ncbi:Glycerate dehydrogenase [Streptomyces sp. RB5]|uniref:Glycerate dehydrogenase n=1 Tax=Streptomyces smaragdinus TaxID=2585196 RepID=A0A7K0CNJ4_9ACTN|nr:NAD(P)-dependent oxidoreductase [Streptomyces smaragdinus]MQY15048.1 Glycerate dehydrogenase [Streptomyces smaragdinus]
MKLIYLDEPTYLPDQWRHRFAALGDFEVFSDRPDADTAVHRLCDADLAIVEWTRLTADMLDRVTRLRYLTVVTSAFDGIDLDAARRAGVTVAHCPNYSRQAVAEHVFATLLSLVRRIPAADRATRDGASHLYPPFLGRELHGQTLGLIGTGRIAVIVASMAKSFGMQVIATNRSQSTSTGLTLLSLEDVLHNSDVVSLHIPLDSSTRGLLNEERLELLRSTAVVVNTSRAGLVDQHALVRMLSTRRLAGAALDDISDEDAETLRTLDNVLLTPGIGWYTDRSRSENLQEIYDNLESYLAGRPLNVLTRH